MESRSGLAPTTFEMHFENPEGQATENSKKAFGPAFQSW